MLTFASSMASLHLLLACYKLAVYMSAQEISVCTFFCSIDISLSVALTLVTYVVWLPFTWMGC